MAKFDYLDIAGLTKLVSEIKNYVDPNIGKVANKAASTTKAYVTGTTSATDSLGTQVFDTGVYLDTTAGQLTATTFKGNLSGNASSASTAAKLGTNAGSSTQPVYFNDGVPVSCEYTLSASVPADAVFTDTVYTLPTAGSTLGGVKTTSTVTSASGYTACPIISGVPYYKDTTYSSMSASEATAGTATTARTITAKVLNDKIASMLPAVTKVAFTATDSRWGSASDGKYPLTIAASGGEFLNCYRTNGNVYDKVEVSVSVSGDNIIIYSLDKFAGYVSYLA